MDKQFRFRLTMILIIFVLVISLIIAIFEYNKLKSRVLIEHADKVELAEATIVNSLHTIDEVYDFTDKSTAERMKKHSEEMINMYNEDPDFANWDFASLSEKYGMEIYIINSENVITHSSFKRDIGLDFVKCCGSLAKLIDERRKNNVFAHDGMEIQQVSGQIKKFSYMPTPDQQYIIELGFSLEEDEIFKRFNFLETIETLESNYSEINSINVYSTGGLILGYTTIDGKSREVSDEMRPIFKEVLDSGKAKEKVVKTDEGNVTYRYVPYNADEIRGLSTKRIVEIVYNEVALEDLLVDYRNQFLLELLVIVMAVVGLSYFIARLVSRPVYLAFHDSLTDLKNRAAFEDELLKRLEKKNQSVALMMIDIDNFKLVNDHLGHAEGDQILKHTANIIKEEAGEGNVAARVGGDEFVVVFTNISEDKIKKVATTIIDKSYYAYKALRYEGELDVSISAGIAYAEDEETIDSLYDKADRALYKSKENGKNQFTIYSNDG